MLKAGIFGSDIGIHYHGGEEVFEDSEDNHPYSVSGTTMAVPSLNTH